MAGLGDRKFNLMEVLFGSGILPGILPGPLIPLQLYVDFDKSNNFFLLFFRWQLILWAVFFPFHRFLRHLLQVYLWGMEMVVIHRFNNYISANITLSRIRDAGIPAALLDEVTVTLDPILSNAIGGIKLAVRADFAEQAMEFLRLLEKERMATALCPKCGSQNIELVTKQAPGNMITAILTWFLGSYAIAPQKVYQCQNCGYECDNFPENTTSYN